MEWTIFPLRTDAAKEAMAMAGDADLKRNWGCEGGNRAGVYPRHQAGSFERVAEFIEPLVECTPGFTDIFRY